MLRWKKGLAEKKGLRVKSSEANMFIKHICLFSSLDLSTRLELQAMAWCIFVPIQ